MPIVKNPLYNLTINPILLCQYCISSVSGKICFPYFSHLFPSHFGVPMPFSIGGIGIFNSSFRKSISHIFSMSSKPKMIRIATRRIVARMANAHPFWNLSFVNLVREDVCSNSVFSFNAPNLTVSISSSRGLPKPATFGLYNFIKKSFPCFFRVCSHC